MLRVDQLVDRVRAWTENEDATSTSGIPDQDIIDALSDGQDMLQGAILRNVPECRWFDASVSFSVTAGQPTYSIPDRAFYSDAIRLVEFSFNGLSDYFVKLNPVQIQHLGNWATWPPTEYGTSGQTIQLSPPPKITQGTLRVKYVKRVPKLARILGQATSLESTSLTLDFDTFLDSTELSAIVPTYLSASAPLDGAGISYAITASAYNSGTRVLTVTTPTYEGSYGSSDIPQTIITPGLYTTHLPQWPVAIQGQVERYLRAYGAWKILGRDSSQDRAEQGNELTAIEGDIINAANAARGDYPVVTMETW